MVDAPRRNERIPQFLDVAGAEYLSAEPLCVERQVHRQPFAIAVLGVVTERAIRPISIARSEPSHTLVAGKPADRGETFVVHQHHRELGPLLDGRHDLLRHHQIRTVADHHIDLA